MTVYPPYSVFDNPALIRDPSRGPDSIADRNPGPIRHPLRYRSLAPLRAPILELVPGRIPSSHIRGSHSVGSGVGVRGPR